MADKIFHKKAGAKSECGMKLSNISTDKFAEAVDDYSMMIRIMNNKSPLLSPACVCKDCCYESIKKYD